MHSLNSSQRFLESLTKALQSYEVDKAFDASEIGKARVLLIGNGGSSAIASHIANDLVKSGKAALSLCDPPTLTCLANDYGYEEAFAHQVRVHGRAGDVLVAISSSGRSFNIRNAVHAARESGLTVVTLTGFRPDNPLRDMGEHNYWVPGESYGIVECAHLAILHSLVSVDHV